MRRTMMAMVFAAAFIGCGDKRDEGSGFEKDADTDTDTVPCTNNVLEGDYTIGSTADIGALAGAREITGNVQVETEELTDLTGLHCLETIGGRLTMETSPVSGITALTDVDGLSGLMFVAGDLVIFGQYALTDLDGLSNLTAVGGTLDVYNNELLIDLEGLSGVTSLGADLSVSFNASLTNIDGLAAITTVDGGLTMFNNDVLCQSAVDAYVATVTVSGTTTDTPNDPGC